MRVARTHRICRLMAQTAEELLTDVFVAVTGLTDDHKLPMLHLMYTPDTRLEPLIKEMEALVDLKRAGKLSGEQQQQLGYMLEKVALLVFQKLTGVNDVKSCQTAGPQHDLLVSGIELPWRIICKTMLNVETSCSILVEAKAKKGKVGDPEFQRLGSILSHHLNRSAGLGVFLSLEGASGFPDRGERFRSVQAARLTQLVIYHSIKKPIVVLDWEDIKGLTRAGSLVTTIARKVREIEEMVGLPTALPGEPHVTVLPEHLKPLCRFG